MPVKEAHALRARTRAKALQRPRWLVAPIRQAGTPDAIESALMLAWLTSSGATVVVPPEGTALLSTSLVAAGEGAICTSIAQDKRLGEWCAKNCGNGFCPATTCTCTPSTAQLQASDESVHALAAPAPAAEVQHKHKSFVTTAPAAEVQHKSFVSECPGCGHNTSLTPTCKALSESGPEGHSHIDALIAGGWAIARSHPALLVSAIACSLDNAKAPARPPPPRTKGERRIARMPKLLACPLNTPNATGSSDSVLGLHGKMQVAGFLRLDGSNRSLHVTDPKLYHVTRGAANHETKLWPRPAVCATNNVERLDLQKFIDRPQLTKLVNEKRGFEYRPVLKAGSTMMRHLLPCLQPDEWREVPQSTPVGKGMTLLVLQRDPISRWASALVEVMERVFRQQCPEGPCNKERDAYEKGVTPGQVKKATLWYDVAEQLMAEPSNNRTALLRQLVRTAALDSSCNPRYYASVHFASQTGLLMQGRTPDETPGATEPAHASGVCACRSPPPAPLSPLLTLPSSTPSLGSPLL